MIENLNNNQHTNTNTDSNQLDLFKLSNEIIKELLNNFESTKQVNNLLLDFIRKQPLAISNLVKFYHSRINSLEITSLGLEEKQKFLNNGNLVCSIKSPNNGDEYNGSVESDPSSSILFSHDNTNNNNNNSMSVDQLSNIPVVQSESLSNDIDSDQFQKEKLQIDQIINGTMVDWKSKYNKLLDEFQSLKKTIFNYDQLKSNIEFNLNEQFNQMHMQFINYLSNINSYQEKFQNLYQQLSITPFQPHLNIIGSPKRETIIDMELFDKENSTNNGNDISIYINNSFSQEKETIPNNVVARNVNNNHVTEDIDKLIHIFNDRYFNFQLLKESSDNSIVEFKKYLEEYKSLLQDYSSMEKYFKLFELFIQSCKLITNNYNGDLIDDPQQKYYQLELKLNQFLESNQANVTSSTTIHTTTTITTTNNNNTSSNIESSTTSLPSSTIDNQESLLYLKNMEIQFNQEKIQFEMKEKESQLELFRLLDEVKNYKERIESEQEQIQSYQLTIEELKKENSHLTTRNGEFSNMVENLTSNLEYFTKSESQFNHTSNINNTNNNIDNDNKSNDNNKQKDDSRSNDNSMEIDDDESGPSSQKEYFDKETQLLKDRIRDLELENAQLISANMNISSLKDENQKLQDDCQSMTKDIIDYKNSLDTAVKEKLTLQDQFQYTVSQIKSVKDYLLQNTNNLIYIEEQYYRPNKNHDTNGMSTILEDGSSPNQMFNTNDDSFSDDLIYPTNHVNNPMPPLSNSSLSEWIIAKVQYLIEQVKRINTLNAKINDLNETLMLNENRLNQSKNEYSNIQQELNSNLVTLHSQKEQTKSLNMDILMLTSELEEKDRTIILKSEELIQMQKKISSIEVEITKLTDQIQEDKEDIIKLEEQKKSNDQRLKEQSEKYLLMNSNYIQSQNELNTAKNQILQITSELDIEKEKLEHYLQLENSLAESKNQLHLERESFKYMDKQIKQLNATIQTKETTIQEQNEEIQLLLREKTDALTSISPLKEKIEKLQANQNDINNISDAYNNLKSLYREKIDTYDELDKKYNEKKQQLQSLKQTSESNDQKIKELDTQVESKDNEITKLKFEMQQCFDLLSKKEKLYNSHKKENEQLLKENNEMKQSLDNIQSIQSQQSSTHRNKETDLNKSIVECKAEILSITKRFREEQVKASLLQESKDELEKLKEDLSSENIKLKSSVEYFKAMDTTTNSKDIEIRKLKKEIDYLNTVIEKKNKEVQDLVATQNNNNNNGKHISPSKKRNNEEISKATASGLINNDNNNDVDNVPTKKLKVNSNNQSQNTSPTTSSSSSSSTSTKSSKPTKYIFSLTGFKDEHDSYKRKLIDDIISLGGEIKPNDFDATITHVTSNSSSITMKTISAVLTHKWLVPPNWIEDSKKAGHFIPETGYGEQFHQKPFSGKKFHLSESFLQSKIAKDQSVKILITMIGRGIMEQDESKSDYVLVSNDFKKPENITNPIYLTWGQFLNLVPQPTVFKKTFI